MKYIKLFEEYEYEGDDCTSCSHEDEFREEDEFGDDEFGDDESNEDDDEFDYEKNGTKYGGKYLDEPPSEIYIESKKSKPDFLDIDKDGDKKESMKKALKDKGSKKDRGLSAAQKKLPAGLRAAIARKSSKGKARD